MAGFFKEIGNFLLGEGLSTFKKTVDKTIKDIEVKVERATIKVIKTATLFLMIFLGVIFILVGLATYLNENVRALNDGLGTILIGAVLIVLALFVRVMK
ncbi:hypothetical protein KY348_01650 [Candidatus Woesearchaeota archaeon]|nr:hypothetical protein [Candidatus Woesearchaeota archaeon]